MLLKFNKDSLREYVSNKNVSFSLIPPNNTKIFIECTGRPIIPIIPICYYDYEYHLFIKVKEYTPYGEKSIRKRFIQEFDFSNLLV